jgi:hypothetical protein
MIIDIIKRGKMTLLEMFCIWVTKLIKKVVQRREDYDFCTLFTF